MPVTASITSPVKSRIPAASLRRPNDRHKAITTAGDFTDFANHKKRQTHPCQWPTIKVNCNKALQDQSRTRWCIPTIQVQVQRRFLVMIQLNILSGRKAGAQSQPAVFLYRIGRASGNELQLDDDGIWQRSA